MRCVIVNACGDTGSAPTGRPHTFGGFFFGDFLRLNKPIPTHCVDQRAPRPAGDSVQGGAGCFPAGERMS